jgi:hypothetical protein
MALSTGEIIAIVIGVIFFIVLIVVLIVWLTRKNKPAKLLHLVKPERGFVQPLEYPSDLAIIHNTHIPVGDEDEFLVMNS